MLISHSPSLLPQLGQNFAVELTVTPHFGHIRWGVMVVFSSLANFTMELVTIPISDISNPIEARLMPRVKMSLLAKKTVMY
jgi:hypothetical protein